VIGASTTNKELACLLEELPVHDGMNQHQIDVIQEAAQRIRELPDEEDE